MGECTALYAKSGNAKKWFALVTIAFLNIPCGFSWCIGNLSVYTDSYFINKLGAENHTSGSLCLISVYKFCTVASYCFAKPLAQRLGLWTVIVVACICTNVAVFTTHFAIQYSVWAMNITFGALGGLFTGLTYSVGLCCATAILPGRVGMVTAVLSLTSALGGIVLNPIITFYINPEDKVPNTHSDNSVYFTDKNILQRVPYVFLVLGGISTLCHVGPSIVLKFLPSFSILDKEFTSVEGFYPYEKTVTYRCSDEPGERERMISLGSPTRDLHKSWDEEQTTGPLTIDPERTISPRQMLTTWSFYNLTLVMIPLSVSITMTFYIYKQFGMVYIKDDHFLTSVGVIMGVAVCISRFGWGLIVELWGPKTSLIMHSSLSTLLTVSWFFTPMISKWLYLIWTLAIQAVNSALDIATSAMIFNVFGSQHFVCNFGIIQTCSMAIGLVAPLLTDAVQSNFGYFWSFLVVSVGSLGSLALTLTLPS